jgi:hypothetical protein
MSRDPRITCVTTCLVWNGLHTNLEYYRCVGIDMVFHLSPHGARGAFVGNP